MISPMSRFEVVGPRELLWDTLDVLQDLGCCHLDPTPLEVEGTDLKLARPELSEEDQAFQDTCAELDVEYQALLATIPASIFRQEEDIAATTTSLSRRSREELLVLARTRLGNWKRLDARIRNLEEDHKLYSMYSRVLDGIDRLQVRAHATVIPLVTELLPADQRQVLQELAETGQGDTPIESVSRKLGGGSFLLALAVPQDREAAIREYLWENKLTEVVFPSEFADLSPLKVRRKIEDRLQTIPDELDELREQMEDYLADFGIEMISVGHILADHIARFQAHGTAALTRLAFRLTGWAPMEDYKRVEDTVSAFGDGVVGIHRMPMDHESTPPTKLDNPGFARPFETLLAVFPPPAAGSVDPTLTIVLTFPLFFGYMVGDAGYGTCMLLLAVALRLFWAPKYPVLKDVSYIFGLAALSATFFGVLFGEYFGHLGVFVLTKYGFAETLHGLDPADPWHGHVHLWIGRTEDYLPRYLAYSCLLGVAHMGFSLLLGTYTALNHYQAAAEHEDREHMEHAVSHALEKIAMLLSLVGFVLVSVGGIVPDLAYIGQGITSSEGLLQNLGLGLVVLAMATLAYALPGLQKFVAPIEGLAVLSNTISYSRLMAVGVAGVVLAGIANDVGKMGFAPDTHIAVTIACLVGAFLIHVGALLIAIFDPMIQGLRLHYVEFFGKFYESEGLTYAPLARKGGSSR